MRIPPVTVVLALFAFTLAHPAYAGQGEDMNAFFGSGYSYCDAKVLSAYWKVDISEAKARIGAEVSRGAPRKVELQLEAARKKLKGRKRVMCDYWETKYAYEDAEALAAAWGTDITEAKARIGKEVSLGRGKALDDKLKALGRVPGATSDGASEGQDEETQALEKFWNSGLGYCDAELLAALWGADISQVKVSMGLKILGGNHDLLASELTRARESARTGGQRCEFWGTPYSPEDAAALATFWGISVEDTKARVAAAYTAGGRASVDPQLKAARGLR